MVSATSTSSRELVHIQPTSIGRRFGKQQPHSNRLSSTPVFLRFRMVSQIHKFSLAYYRGMRLSLKLAIFICIMSQRNPSCTSTRYCASNVLSKTATSRLNLCGAHYCLTNLQTLPVNMPPSQLCAKGGCEDPPVAGTALKLAKEEHTDWGQPSHGDYLLSMLPRSLGPKVFFEKRCFYTVQAFSWCIQECPVCIA